MQVCAPDTPCIEADATQITLPDGSQITGTASITRNGVEYRRMLGKALGGGAAEDARRDRDDL